MNKQELFDKALKAMRAQGCASVRMLRDMDSICAYNGSNGTHCAIGHLIESDDLRKRMDSWNGGARIVSLVQGMGGLVDEVRNALGITGATKVTDVEFLRKLQGAHDQAVSTSKGPTGRHGFMHYFELNMRAVAASFDLKYQAA